MQKNIRNKTFFTVLILVILLVLPGFLYFLLRVEGKNNYKPLPFFGEKSLAKTVRKVMGREIPDTIYHTIGNFNFTNQYGESVNDSLWKGKVVVAHLFANKNEVEKPSEVFSTLNRLYDKFGKNRILCFSSILISGKQSLTDLQKITPEINHQKSHWQFLTADTSVVYPFVRNSLLLDVVYDHSRHQFIHTNKFVLIDTHGRIRGFYDAASDIDKKRLDDEIIVLITEEIRNMKDGR